MRHFSESEKLFLCRADHAVFRDFALRGRAVEAILRAMKRAFLAVMALAIIPTVAPAASSNWVEAEGARIRLVTAGAPKADGRLDAVLEIGLKPGWKTYWIDPGEAGVPPSLTMAGSGDAVALRLPAPTFIEEGEVRLVGYDRPVRFVASLPAPGGIIETDLFIGICEKICVPVAGRLTLDPAHDPDNARETAIVEEALLALPGEPRAGFRARAVSVDDKTLTVDAEAPPDSGDATLYIASAGEWMFGLSGPDAPDNGRASFTAPVTRPAGAQWPQDGFVYVLVADGIAVEGRLAQP